MGKISNLITSFRNMALLNESLEHQRFLVKRDALQQGILHIGEKGTSEEKYCEYDIVVSLTSYGRRLREVALTIESIMEQTMKANRIILWLAEEEKSQSLPHSLRLLQKRGLEVYYCKDIRSYKKLIPTLKMCPNDAIITIDDDVFYEYDVLENLIEAHLKSPNCVQAHYTHIVEKTEDGEIKPYVSWKRGEYGFEPDFKVFPVGVGGVLYPPHCFDEEVFNEDCFMGICKYGDDIWFKAMSIRNGVKAAVVFSHHKYGEDFIVNQSEQGTGLWNVNVHGESLNDTQLRNVFEKYNLINKV